MNLNDFTREAERFRDIDRAVMRQLGDDISDERVGESPALASPAVCASCDNTGCDLSSGEPCSQCPTGTAFRAELRQCDPQPESGVMPSESKHRPSDGQPGERSHARDWRGSGPLPVRLSGLPVSPEGRGSVNNAQDGEPCYGTCAGCGARDAELWRTVEGWRCWNCKERA